jgi:glycerate 2-kinase
MKRDEARNLVRSLFLKTLPHLQVGPKMRQVVRYRDGVLEIRGDRIPLHPGRPVRVVAMGKAAIEMTHTLAEILPDVRLRGVVAAPALPKYPLPGFEYFAGGHPYPNEDSWRAAEAALRMMKLRNQFSNDLILFLISGGGSSLMELPVMETRPGSRLPSSVSITLGDLQRFYEVLVTCGAKIEEINAVRKHFSAVKGGRLAEAAFLHGRPYDPPVSSGPWQVTLYISDVPEHSPSLVASGPTMPDETTWQYLDFVFMRHHLAPRLPEPYSALWRIGVDATPKSGDECFARSLYYCLLANSNGTEKMAELTETAGVIAEIDTRCDDWNFQKAADYLLDALRGLRRDNPGKAVAVISGGELSCPVTGDGMGGRNQAFVLDCVTKIAGTPTIVLSAGTDGIDGNSLAAGAIADGDTFFRARNLSLDPEDYQQRSDSFHFFEKLGDTILTGPTGTNVRDLRVLMAYE